MRVFTVRKGKYTGEHIIWDNVQEAETHGITNIRSPWYGDNVQNGDWCITDDGFVMQCFYRRTLVNKRHTSGQHTDIFRFANGTAYVYYDRKGEKLIKNLYGGAVYGHKNSLTKDNGNIGKYMNPKKKYFCTLLVGGMDPYHAYIKVYSPPPSTKGAILASINKLLSDKYVREELMVQLQPFIDQVTIEIKEKTGYESLKDFLASKLAELASDVDASNKDKIAMIKLMIDLFGVQLGIVGASKKDPKEIQQADYETLAPPQLS